MTAELYVDADAVSNGTGLISDPFNSLANMEAGAADKDATDETLHITVFLQGTDTSSGYVPNGWTTDSGHHLRIEVWPGFEGTWNAYGTSPVIESNATSHVVTSEPNEFLDIVGIELFMNHTGNSDEGIRVSSASTVFVDKYIIRAASQSANQDGCHLGDTVATLTLQNGIMNQWGRRAINCQNNSDDIQTVTLDSVEIDDCGDSVTNGGGFMWNVDGTQTYNFTVNNCGIFRCQSGAGDVSYGPFSTLNSPTLNFAGDFNVSDDTTAETHFNDGGNSVNSVSLSTSDGPGTIWRVTDLTPGSEDYTPLEVPSGTDAQINAGATDLNEDIRGFGRPSGSQDDRGPFEFSEEIMLMVSMDGTSNMTSDVEITRVLAVTMAGVGTFIAPTLDMTLLFDLPIISGVGEMSAELLREVFPAVTISSVATMTADAFITIEALEVTMAGVATMTADVDVLHVLEATMAGVSTVILGDLEIIVPLEVTMSGVGEMIADLSLGNALAVTMSGVATMTADLDLQLAAIMSATSEMIAELAIERFVAATMSGVGTMIPELHIDHPVSATMSGVATMTSDLSIVRALAVTMAGVGTMTADVDILRVLEVTMAGVSTVTPALSIDPLLEVTMSGMGEMVADVVVFPPGGAPLRLDSEQVEMAESKRAAATSAYSHPIHGQFVIPVGFRPVDSIRIAKIPAAHQLASLTVTSDQLGMGSMGLMQVGTATQVSAFIANVNILVPAICVMTLGGDGARPNRDSDITIVLTFSGPFTFTPGTTIRVVGNAILMPEWQEEALT